MGDGEIVTALVQPMLGAGDPEQPLDRRRACAALDMAADPDLRGAARSYS
jgi:hypothetical protein